MEGDHAWGGMITVAERRPKLLEDLRDAVRERGPVTLAELEHLGDAIKRGKAAPGNMWNWSDAKKAVEWLFWRGEVSAVRNPSTFGRHYVAPEQVLPEAVLAAPVPGDDDAMKALLLRAARSHGVGTARCLADYHRLNIVTTRRLLTELAADGALRQVEVEGWRQPAYLHPEAQLPRWVRASALLSPFDSLVWERERTEALFGFRYRIEIYVPAAKRVHGYYVLPFLHDGRLVAARRPEGRPPGRLCSASGPPTPSPPSTTTRTCPPSASASRSWPASSACPTSPSSRRAISPPPSNVCGRSRPHRERDRPQTSSEAGEDVAAVAVTTRVCSNWAVRRRSTVTAVQPSSQRSCSHAPTVIIGSMVKVMPSSITAVSRGS